MVKLYLHILYHFLKQKYDWGKILFLSWWNFMFWRKITFADFRNNILSLTLKRFFWRWNQKYQAFLIKFCLFIYYYSCLISCCIYYLLVNNVVSFPDDTFNLSLWKITLQFYYWIWFFIIYHVNIEKENLIYIEDSLSVLSHSLYCYLL